MHRNDQLAELAMHIISALEKEGVHARLTGGIGYWVRFGAQRERLARLGRIIHDIDLVAERGDQSLVTRTLENQWGMESDRTLLAIPELDRSMHTKLSKQGPPIVCDVNYGGLRYSHFIDLSGRLHINPFTLSLADLLLSKLQIRKLSVRDAQDLLFLLLQFEFGPSSKDEAIDLARITNCCAHDFGLTQTILLNVEVLKQHIPTIIGSKSLEDVELLEHRIERLESAIANEPKPIVWKACSMWSRAFPRFKWYSDVDDLVPSIQDR